MKTETEICKMLLALTKAESEMLEDKDMSGVSYFEGKINALQWVLGEQND